MCLYFNGREAGFLCFQLVRFVVGRGKKKKHGRFRKLTDVGGGGGIVGLRVIRQVIAKPTTLFLSLRQSIYLPLPVLVTLG